MPSFKMICTVCIFQQVPVLLVSIVQFIALKCVDWNDFWQIISTLYYHTLCELSSSQVFCRGRKLIFNDKRCVPNIVIPTDWNWLKFVYALCPNIPQSWFKFQSDLCSSSDPEISAISSIHFIAPICSGTNHLFWAWFLHLAGVLRDPSTHPRHLPLVLGPHWAGWLDIFWMYFILCVLKDQTVVHSSLANITL
jgi:hypothetical protein